MKTADIVIVVLVLVILLLLLRRTSGYSEADRRATVASYVGGKWMDIDATQTSTWTATTLVPAGTSGGVDLNNVGIANLNSLMWVGSNVLSTGQTISLPSGVTTNNVKGIRKQIGEDASGNPIGKNLQFITRDLSGLLTRTCEVGANWDSGIPDVGRVGLPDHFILLKSAQDPRGAVDCTYTAVSAGCDAPCGKTGKTKYTITGFSAAQYGGTCPAYKGAQITGNGTVTSTETCTSPACSLASLDALNKFLGLGAGTTPRAPAPAPITAGQELQQKITQLGQQLTTPSPLPPPPPDCYASGVWKNKTDPKKCCSGQKTNDFDIARPNFFKCA